MNKLRNIIATDLITTSGGKNSWRVTGVLFLVGVFVVCFLGSPFFAVYCPMILSGFVVQFLYSNEIKYHSENMYSLLPVERRDIVRARFILSIGLYLAGALVSYLLMLLAVKLHLYTYLSDVPDVAELMTENSSMTVMGLYDLVFALVFAVGLKVSAGQLRLYFKDSSAIGAMLGLGRRKTKPTAWERIKGFVIGFLILAAVMIFLLMVTGIIPVKGAGYVIIMLISNIAQLADGALLGGVAIFMAVMDVVYQYISTVCEYDDKEL